MKREHEDFYKNTFVVMHASVQLMFSIYVISLFLFKLQNTL